ncbi:PX domain containing protein [Acanthamoeba castellanii str. Neff]|uniref:PX domain containing protein n=1 Tax=Acanthamoeba castellanii (strain ATCC 30010 / Neff) TaxID=1257118 RepID=L8GSW2_ACACF|nr:PX domain containing protein [Acanthamoeba castellanii str. Neff]ELR16022.1 PX domain containing protein [Acanthamoeba castellanii str. Neff]
MKEETKPSATKQAASQHKPGVSVSIPKTQVFTELSNGKPYIVFEIHFFIDGEVVHVSRRRYSSLKVIHEELQKALGKGSSTTLPAFPSANHFKNYAKPPHTEARRLKLVGYLNALVQEPAVLVLPHFHKLFTMDHPAVTAMRSAAGQLLGERRARDEEVRRAREATLRQAKADWHWAQTFVTGAPVIELDGVAMRAHVPLTYDRPVAFTIQEREQALGDMTIFGPGEEPWFEAPRMDRSIVNFGGSEYGIFNMKGEQLMSLEKIPSNQNRYEIYHVVNPAEDRSEKALVKIASVTRGSAGLLGVFGHEIVLADGAVIEYKGASFGNEATLHADGVAGHDVLLHLAITICIEKLHNDWARPEAK